MNETAAPTTPTIPDAIRESLDVTTTVVTAVADAEGVSPIDLEPPLYETVDTDALDRLVASIDEDAGETITFPYRGYDVTVEADGCVSIGR